MLYEINKKFVFFTEKCYNASNIILKLKMNIALEKFLQNELLTEKDKYEIRQIFEMVDDVKKQNILKNFDKILIAIVKIKQELREQQEILLGRAVSNIERAIKLARNSWIKNATTGSIYDLKQIL